MVGCVEYAESVREESEIEGENDTVVIVHRGN
jgi:hypothetical protein